MKDLNEIGKMLMNSSKADKIKAAANSPEAQKLSKIIDARSVEQAAKSGDMATLQKALAQVMSTEEGKRLAARLSEEFNKE
ncbi:MAG TPA: hypothetical protein GXZ52_05755 [Clostridiales bacterium]|nr:hypothetical protein [Clostridiales bacterium]